MTSAKDVRLKVIPAQVANPFIKRHHYSGKVVQNSSLHFGAFIDGKLHGVMSYGPSLDKRKIQGLVEGTHWNGFLELNRMAFDDKLPRNSESRCIAMSLRMIRKQAPHVKWVISFADGCSCGDGTIYRASGFVLTGIKKNSSIAVMPDGSKIHEMTLKSSPLKPLPQFGGRSYFDITGGRNSFKKFLEVTGGKAQPGYQLRYIRFLYPGWEEKLKVPVIPFSAIDDAGAGMYKGEHISMESRHHA